MLDCAARSVINFHPLILAQETPANAAIAQMNQTGDRCVLVTQQTAARGPQLVGVFTAEDVVKLVATGHLPDCSLQQVMAPLAQQLNLADLSNCTISELLPQFSTLPLPVVNEVGEPIGVITDRSLLTAIQSAGSAVGSAIAPSPSETLPCNEECLRQLVENSREVLYVHDIPPQRVLYVSPAYEAIWGQSRDYLYQNPYVWLEAIHPEDRKRIQAEMWALQQAELVELEYRIIRSDGTVRWICARTTPIRDANGTIYRWVGNAADVTERKLAEQSLQQLNQELEQRIQERTAELEQSNQQLRSEILEREQVQAALAHEQAFLRCLLDTIPDLIFYKDAQGAYRAVNRAFEAFAGYSQAEILGHDDRDLFSAPAAASMQAKDRYVFSQQQPLRNEELVTYAGGQQGWVETLKVPFFSSQGELAGLIGISRDITDRKQVEAILAARERYLQAVVEVQRQLLATRGDATNYREALAPLGKASDASRVYLFTNHHDETGKLFMRQQAEWCAAGIQPEIDNPDLQHLPYEGGFVRWAQVLAGGGAIVGAVANFSETEQLILEPQGILSILVIPLLVNGAFYGFIGFDHCLEEHHWNPAEVTLLQAAAAAISMHQERELAEASLRDSQEQLNSILNSLEDGVWSVALPSKQLIYLNRAIERIYHRPIAAFMNDSDLWFKVIHPDDRSIVETELQSLFEQNSYNIQYRIVLPNGEIRWVHERAQMVRGGETTPHRVDGIVTDITRSKQAENALRQSEERYALATTQSLVGVWDWNLKTNSIYISPNLKGILGYSDAEIPNQLDVWANFIHPDDKAMVMQAAQAHIDGLNPVYEVPHRMLHKDGSIRWILVRGTVFRDEKGQPIRMAGTDTDITQLKQADMALRESEERFRELAENISAVFWLIDPEQKRCLYLSPAFDRIWGQSSQQFHNSGDWLNTVHPEDREALLKVSPSLVEQEQEQEYRILRPDGEIRWIRDRAFPIRNEAGTVYRIGGIAEDITERKQQEAALRDSAKRERATLRVVERMRQTLDIQQIFQVTTEELRHLLNCDRVVIYAWSQQGKSVVAESVAADWRSLTSLHQEFPQLTDQILSCDCYPMQLQTEPNLDGSPTISTPAYVCVSDVDISAITPTCRECLNLLQARAYLTVPIYQGNQFWGMLTSYQNTRIHAWKETEINLAIHIGTQLGIALQQAELLVQTQQQSAELEKARDAAEAANRAKSEFLANMSHELRTPLNAILGFTQIMSRDRLLNPHHQEYLSTINRCGQHLLSLINDVLEMSKIETGNVSLKETNFDLYHLLDSLEEMLRLRAATKQLRLCFDRAADVPQHIHTDERKLRQVLLNLLGNAIKFTQIGQVTLRVRTSHTQPSSLPFSLPSCTLQFEVEDTGCGIADNELNNLFQAFVQTKTGQQANEGAGLGLIISRKFVNLMGGDIQVNSTVGQGSTFSFTIAVHQCQASTTLASSDPRQVVALATGQPRYRILIVEDQWENSQFLLTLLTSLGFSVRQASNGQEGLETWKNWHPHLILMDMRMPVMDGYEATKQIRSQESSIIHHSSFAETIKSPIHPEKQLIRDQTLRTKIIALTASVFKETQSIVLAAGCDDILHKPVQLDLLLEKLAQHLEVNYRYEPTLSISAPSDSLATVTPDLHTQLNQMSIDWIRQLHRAALKGSDDKILQLSQQIPAEQVALKETLTTWSHNFWFNKITDLIEQGVAECG